MGKDPTSLSIHMIFPADEVAGVYHDFGSDLPNPVEGVDQVVIIDLWTNVEVTDLNHPLADQSFWQPGYWQRPPHYFQPMRFYSPSVQAQPT